MHGSDPQPVNIPDGQGKRPPVQVPESYENRWVRIRKRIFLWGGIALFLALAVFFFMSAAGSDAYS